MIKYCIFLDFVFYFRIYCVKLYVLIFVMARDDLTSKDQSDKDPPKSDESKKQKKFEFNDQVKRTLERCRELTEKPGVYSVIHMAASGLKYTGVQDTATCEDCKVALSNWTIDKKPFLTHSQEKPDCSFVHWMKTPLALAGNASDLSISTQSQQSCNIQSKPPDILNEIRRRTFSYWFHHNTSFKEQMIKAGFFSCNVGDRVICLYCNLICQQWVSYKDDPCEVHKTLSPNCSYMREKLSSSSTGSEHIVDDSSTKTISNNNPTTSTAALNAAYTELSKRRVSFATRPRENLPSTNDSVRVGFFNTGTKTTETCDYYKRSLEKQGPNDNPMIEHARQFPHWNFCK